jgi:hypothetical protein
MLLPLHVGHREYEFGVVSKGMMSISNCISVLSAILELKLADRRMGQTYMISSVCVHFVLVMQETRYCDVMAFLTVSVPAETAVEGLLWSSGS